MSQTKAQHYKSKITRLIAMIMAVLLIVTALPAMDTAMADSDGMIRVKLTRLGSAVSSITMTTVGGYAVNGTAVSSGTTVKVTLSGSTLTLTAGGKQIASGSRITMSRVSGGTGTGVRFTSPSLANLFCGDLTFSVSGSSIQTVLSIYIETYLYGVVPYEMSNSFPVEALKAQAIAARTYAMRAKRSGGSYDVTDNTSSQSFKGYKSSYANAIEAVDGTRGVVLMSGSAYAQCYYTASNGGQTESTKNAWGSSSVSYLTVKDDPYDRENPNSIVKSYVIPKNPGKKALDTKLEAALIEAAAGQLKEKGLSTKASDVTIEKIIDVHPHTPKYDTPSRTYTRLRFVMQMTSESESTGNEVSTQVEVDLDTYAELQSMLNLSINSADNEIVSVEEEEDAFRFSFARFGHGIGMSQRGAQWMAREYGMTYEEILFFYYPGARQTRLTLNEIIAGESMEPVPTPSRAPVESEDGYTTLQEGDSGEAVKRLQTRLKELGYFTGTPLGNYKALTISAVKAYQQAMGLKADGIATPALQKMIFAEQRPTVTPAPTRLPEQQPSDEAAEATVSLGSSSSRLNVRKSASTSSSVVGTLKHGARVRVLSILGEWRQIQSGDLIGYVKAEYLKFDKPENEAGYATLQYGDSGEAVRALQEQLGKLGFFTGTPLGNYKNLTVAAVKAYQEAMGLEADGIATPALQEMIFAGKLPESTPQPKPTAAPELSGMTATVSLGSSSSRLNVRSEASTSSAIVGMLKHGQTVNVLSVSGGWSQIQSGSVIGYVMSSYLIAENALPTAKPEETPAPDMGETGTAVITLGSASSKMNVRKAATTNSSIVGTLRHGAKVNVLSGENEWSRIQSGDIIGYVKTKYLTFTGENMPDDAPEATTAPETNLTGVAVITLRSDSSKLNVRKAATTSSSIVGTLKHGTKVNVLSSENGWSRIQSGDITGYVMTSYLSESVGSDPTEAPEDTPSGENGYRTLSYGDSGEDVRRLQVRLKELGYFDGQLGGNYLKITRTAVEAYQQANGWAVNGIATPELQREIFEKTGDLQANATVDVESDSYLNLRKSASANATVVVRMRGGMRVRVTGSEGEWYQIETSDGHRGYAKQDYIRVDD